MMNSSGEGLGLPEVACPVVCTTLCCLISIHWWDFMNILPVCRLAVSGWPNSWIIYCWWLANFIETDEFWSKIQLCDVGRLLLFFFKFYIGKSRGWCGEKHWTENLITYIKIFFVAVWNLFTIPLLSKKLLYEQGMRQQSEGKAEEIRLERTGSRKLGGLFWCHQWCVSVPVIFTRCHSSWNSVKWDLIVLLCYD